jgi:hypothetical protein
MQFNPNYLKFKILEKMTNKYIIEFWYKGEVVDLKESKNSLIIPKEGQSIAIMSWGNPNNSEERDWWKVLEVKHGIWKNEAQTILTQKIMVDIFPDPKNGLFKSDPDYNSFDYEVHHGQK